MKSGLFSRRAIMKSASRSLASFAAGIMLIEAAPLKGTPSPGGPGEYILCRGPLRLSLTESSLEIWFMPNPTAAGRSGEMLQAGHGGWMTRPITPNELSEIMLTLSYPRGSQLFSREATHIAAAVSANAGNSSCVFKFRIITDFDNSNGLADRSQFRIEANVSLSYLDEACLLPNR